MNYSEYVPCGELSAFIKCFWILEDNSAHLNTVEKIIPDGCTEFLIHFGDRYQKKRGVSSFELQPRAFIHGQLKQFIELRNTGATGIIGIRFLPFGMSAFTNIPIDQFTDLEVPLEFVFGKSAHHLVEEIMLAPDNDFRVRLLQKYLICNLQPRPRDMAMVEHVVNMINASGGNCSITRLAGAACISERQLVRVFSASVGLTPKNFSKIVRLQRSLTQLGQIQAGAIVDVAFDNGYFDHAHLVRDFRQFTGMTPSDYLKENRDFTDLFIAT